MKPVILVLLLLIAPRVYAQEDQMLLDSRGRPMEFGVSKQPMKRTMVVMNNSVDGASEEWRYVESILKVKFNVMYVNRTFEYYNQDYTDYIVLGGHMADIVGDFVSFWLNESEKQVIIEKGGYFERFYGKKRLVIIGGRNREMTRRAIANLCNEESCAYFIDYRFKRFNIPVEKYLGFGNYTSNSERIRLLSEELYYNETIGPLNSSSSKFFIRLTVPRDESDLASNYVEKVLYYVWWTVSPVSKDDPSYWDAFYNQKSAEWVLDNRKGFCDEASILLASLLRVKGIPVRIVIRGYTGGEFEAQLISPELLQTFTVTHAEEEIWLSRYEKIKTDSSYGARDYWSAMGVEYDLGQNAW